MFPYEKPVKNKRITGKDLETEIQLARWMKRPVRTYANDPPFYPWLPPEPYVNFMLNYKE